jgi:putative flippase GtrA
MGASNPAGGVIGMAILKYANGANGRLLRLGLRQGNALHRLARQVPRPLRFLLVGGAGLGANVALFTILEWEDFAPLLAELLALVVATGLTWRLNRAFTFDRSGRAQRNEAARYAAVTVVAQSTSYAIFAVLASTALMALPQVAIFAGAAAGAFVSYNGHRLFAFAPVESCVWRP